MSKKKLCLSESQIERLQTDTAKLAKGIDQDICPTVREMYEENVPKDLRLKGAAKKKKTQDEVDRIIKGVGKKAVSKLKSKWGKLGDLF